MTTKTEVLLPPETTLLDLHELACRGTGRPRLAAICEAAFDTAPWLVHSPIDEPLPLRGLDHLERNSDHCYFAAQWLATNTLSVLAAVEQDQALDLIDYLEVRAISDYEILADDDFVQAVEDCSKRVEINTELHFPELVQFFTEQTGSRFPYLVAVAPEAGLTPEMKLNASRLYLAGAECWIHGVQEEWEGLAHDGTPFEDLAQGYHFDEFWTVPGRFNLLSLIFGPSFFCHCGEC